MRRAIERLHRDAELFKDLKEILVDYNPDQEYCAVHGARLLVLKTVKRKVRRPGYPPFTARKVYTYCPTCRDAQLRSQNPDWKHSPIVQPLARGNSPFSMEAVTCAGTMKFLECMRRDDIQSELMRRYGIYASDGVLTTMSMEFLARLKCLHMLRFDRIKTDIRAGGGYAFGIDGTGDGGSDRIFTGMDLLRDWVLVAERIPDESEDDMKPYIQFIKEKLGNPLAGVCDMHPGMMKVLENHMTGVPLRVCHYHFTDDVGSDLMETDYAIVRQLVIDARLQSYLKRFRKRMYHDAEKEGIEISRIAGELRSGKIQHGLSVEVCTKIQVYDAISWILRYHEDNNGMQFPYSLPYLNLYERCRNGLGLIMGIRRMAVKGRTSPKYLRELESILREKLEGECENAKKLRSRALSLRRTYAVFEELREKMRIPKDKGDIPRDKLMINNNEKIAEMEKELEEYREKLRKIAEDGKHPEEQIVVQHLDKYWNNIIPKNIVVTIDGRDVLIRIPRTTSGNETCFGMMKSDIRKRLGKKDIGRELNMYGDYLCYVQNLKSDSYVSLICGSMEDLPRAFEEIPRGTVKEEMELIRKRMIGYDITKNGSRGVSIQLEDIARGIKTIENRIDEVLEEQYIRPPEIYGRQSNGILTL